MYSYAVYHDSRKSIPLENSEVGPERRVHQLVVWAPDGNAFVYVHRNNIYYRPTAASKAEVQLTTSGIPGIIYHGIPDWVYEGMIIHKIRVALFLVLTVLL
jgi:hypothetical protein